VDEAMIAAGKFTREFGELMRHEVEYTRSTMREGLPLIGMVERDLAIDLDLFSRGGLEILRAIEEQGYDVLRERPAISKSRKAALLLRALTGKFLGLSLIRQRRAA
jgi:phytoene/squalene synthetase